MGRNAEQNAASRVESRRRLVAAALRLFGTHGVDRVSMDRVAREAGVSKGLAYHYFDGKEGLLRAVLDDRVAAVLALVPEHGTVAARLGAFARRVVASVVDDPATYRLLLATLAHPGGEVRQLVTVDRQAFVARRAGLVHAFRALGRPDPEGDARFFQAGLVGILVLQATSPFAGDPDPLVDRLLAAVGLSESP